MGAFLSLIVRKRGSDFGKEWSILGICWQFPLKFRKMFFFNEKFFIQNFSNLYPNHVQCVNINTYMRKKG